MTTPPADLRAQLDATYPAYLQAVVDRFTRALALASFDGVLIHSGTSPEFFGDDHGYAFKVNAPFKVWAPLTDVPDCFIWFEPGKRPQLLLHQPADYWHKPAVTPESYWTAHFDIHPVPDRQAARALLPQDLGNAAWIGEALPELESWGLVHLNPPHFLRRVDFERAAKTPYELLCLREASRLGVLGHLAAAQAFGSGASEFGIQLAFLAACGLREHELPYNAIIALNEGGAVLHYQVLQKQSPAERRSLLIDAGAEFAGYASDITRTYSFQDADFAALISRMDDVQQSLCSSVHAGVDWRDIHLSSHRLDSELLHDADIIKCDADEAVETGVSSVFLPHGIGHLLGLQVHDAGGLMRSAEGGEIPRPDGHPYLRLTRVLEPGFVVTMEPGIYFIDQLLDAARAFPRGAKINWQRVEQFRPFGGIRIEDDLVVQADGCENLTRDAFSALLAGS
jgi:Xaa-Pro dipeptidase